MNWLRYALIAGICAVSYLLFLEWNAFEEAKLAAEPTNNETLASVNELPTVDELTTAAPSLPSDRTVPNRAGHGRDMPNSAEAEDADENSMLSLPTPEAEPLAEQTPTSITKAQLVSVKTDSLELIIDTFGGDIVKVALPRHLEKQSEDSDPFLLMNRGNAETYVAQSGLIGANGTDLSASDRPIYSSAATSYIMDDSADSLVVDLTLAQDGVNITKRYTFNRASYLVDVDYIVENNSTQLWKAAPYGQIRRNDYEVGKSVMFGMQSYLGAATTTDETNYKEVKFSKIEEGVDSFSTIGGWVSMVQHYFISAWVPDQEAKNTYKFSHLKSKDLYILQYVGPVQTVEPTQTLTIESAFYAGPKDIKTLETISPYLDLTIDYSFLSFIAKPLFYALDYIHGLVGNWGVAIILLTMLIKLIFFYPSAMSYRSMAKMRKLQPMMAELKERYGDDRQKMSGELMKIYRKEKVNPLGGCLPILLQMPVFISLYWVLMESVELRHAPLALWITDLSVKDPFFVLPLIMGATMFIQQKLNPTPPDPMQAKVMQMMPIFFTVLFLFFPAGLVLYWVVNNSLSIAQQYVITKQIENADTPTT